MIKEFIHLNSSRFDYKGNSQETNFIISFCCQINLSLGMMWNCIKSLVSHCWSLKLSLMLWKNERCFVKYVHSVLSSLRLEKWFIQDQANFFVSMDQKCISSSTFSPAYPGGISVLFCRNSYLFGQCFCSLGPKPTMSWGGEL